MPSNTTFAVEGCCHGDLDRIYEVLERIEQREGVAADFMICCGDFQAIRTQYVHDLLEFYTVFIGRSSKHWLARRFIAI